MTEQGTTTSPSGQKKPASRSRSSSSRSGANRNRSHRATNTGQSENQQQGMIGLNVKAAAGVDNPIWQAINYAYNRFCAAHQNTTTPFYALDLLAWTREKYGPRVMSAGGGGGGQQQTA